MKLLYIDDGTSMKANPAVYNEVYEKEYKGTFFGLIGDLSFWYSSKELFDDIDKFSEDKFLRLQFFRMGKLYEFNGKPKETQKNRENYLVKIEQTSVIKEASRRVSPRFEMTIPVVVHAPTGKPDVPYSSDKSLNGVTLDISAEGLCLMSDTDIKTLSDGKVFYLSFRLNKNDSYLLPANMMRSGRCLQSKSYKFEYGFLFDHDENPSERERLLTSIFSHRIMGL